VFSNLFRFNKETSLDISTIRNRLQHRIILQIHHCHSQDSIHEKKLELFCEFLTRVESTTIKHN